MENRNYIVVTSSENCVRWLNEFGDDLGNLMYIDTLDIERIAQLADASDISAILVHLQSQDTRSRAPANESSTKGLRQELSLIEGLVASSPGMPVHWPNVQTRTCCWLSCVPAPVISSRLARAVAK